MYDSSGDVALGAWGCCQRCGWKYRARELRVEWTSLKVCATCWDPRPAELTPPRVGPEGLPLPFASPDPGDTLGPNTTQPSDL